MAANHEIWYPKDYSAEQERRRAMAENPGFANVQHTLRYYPSNEALMEVVEAQRRINKLKKTSANGTPNTDASRSPSFNSYARRAPTAQERENIPSGPQPVVAAPAAADVARAEEWMRQRAMKRNSLEKVKSAPVSEDEARKSRRHVVFEQGTISISVQELNNKVPANTAAAAARGPFKVPRGLEILDEEEEADATRVSDSDSKRVSDAKAQSSARAMPVRLQVATPSLSAFHFPNPSTSPGSGSTLSLSTEGESSSSRTSRAGDANQSKKLVRPRTVSEGAAKAPEVAGTSSATYSQRAASSRSPPSASSAAPLGLFGPDPQMISAPVPQAHATGSAFRYLSGNPGQRKTSRSASDAENTIKRPGGGVPPAPPPTPAPVVAAAKPRYHTPASAWRTISPEDAVRVIKKQARFEIIPEEDAPLSSSLNVPTIFVPSARRSSFESTTSSSSQRSQFNQSVNSHRRTPSAPVVPIATPFVSAPESALPPFPVARPRPPPHIRSLLRKKKGLSGASLEVWTGDLSDPELSAPESTRSSIYSIPPPPDPKVLIDQWRANDAMQVRTRGKRVKPGVTFDFPEEKMPVSTRLTESQVDLLPDAVFYPNER